MIMTQNFSLKYCSQALMKLEKNFKQERHLEYNNIWVLIILNVNHSMNKNEISEQKTYLPLIKRFLHMTTLPMSSQSEAPKDRCHFLLVYCHFPGDSNPEQFDMKWKNTFLKAINLLQVYLHLLRSNPVRSHHPFVNLNWSMKRYVNYV